jgi:hypothetical protein
MTTSYKNEFKNEKNLDEVASLGCQSYMISGLSCKRRPSEGFVKMRKPFLSFLTV